MHYFIDGYNLIGKIPGISFSDPEKENKCVQFLVTRMQGKTDKVTLVFDGRGVLNIFVSKEKRGPITIIFTPNGETADEYLIRKAQNRKGNGGLTIVTSDNDIIYHTKKAKIPFMRSEEFLGSYTPKGVTGSKKPKPSDEDVAYWLDEFDS